MKNIIGSVWRWEAIDDTFGGPWGTVTVLSEYESSHMTDSLRCLEVSHTGDINEKTWIKSLFDPRRHKTHVKMTLLHDPNWKMKSP